MSLEHEQVHTSLKLWKTAFMDAYETICPVRTAVQRLQLLECPFYVGKIKEQCVARLDVAMFNAILRQSKDEGPTEPISNPMAETAPVGLPISFDLLTAPSELVMLPKDMLSSNKVRKENLIMVYFAAIVLPEQSLASEKAGLDVSKKDFSVQLRLVILGTFLCTRAIGLMPIIDQAYLTMKDASAEFAACSIT
ncbi:hypothetical protein Tco_0277468 [Tanacetum coccineum]